MVKKMRGLVLKFAENLARRELAENALRRYVSHQVARRILDSPDGGAAMGEGRRTHVAVLISDIRGFTPMSESMEPEALLELLNGYFSRMVDIVFRHDGTLDKFVGDALIVVFNDPYQQPDAEKRAVTCAVEMQKEVENFNREQAAAGKKTLGVGIGVHCGIVVAGNVGSESRMDYTVGRHCEFHVPPAGQGAGRSRACFYCRVPSPLAISPTGPRSDGIKGYSGSTESGWRIFPAIKRQPLV